MNLGPRGGHRIGVVSAITIVAASMIGVGVYTTSGFAIAALHTPGRVMAAWGVAACIALCGAIGYAALARRFTESGGEYLFLSQTLHPAAGVTAGVVSMLSGFTGGIVLAAIGLERYFAPVVATALPGVPPLPTGTLAVAAILVAATVQTLGVRWAAQAQNAVVAAKILMILAFLGVAGVSYQSGAWPIESAEGPAKSGVPAIVDTNANTNEATSSPSGVPAFDVPAFDVLVFASQLVWISFSFAGFNAAIYLAGEIKSPTRNVPRALIGGTLLVSLVYFLVNAVFVYSVVPSQIAGKPEVATTTAAAIGGPGFAMFVRSVIVVSLFTSIYAMVMTGPRVYAKMADDGFLPRVFALARDRSRRRLEMHAGSGRGPVVGVWFQAVLAAVATVFATLESVIEYLSLTLSLCSALTVAMVIRPKILRSCLRDSGEEPEQFTDCDADGQSRIPTDAAQSNSQGSWTERLVTAGALSAAIVYVTATVALASLVAIESPHKVYAAIATLLVGVALYPWIRNADRPNEGSAG